jgi:hypothetical protein
MVAARHHAGVENRVNKKNLNARMGTLDSCSPAGTMQHTGSLIASAKATASPFSYHRKFLHRKDWTRRAPIIGSKICVWQLVGRFVPGRRFERLRRKTKEESMNIQLRHFSVLVVVLIGSMGLAKALQDSKDTSDSKAPGEVYVSVLPEEAYIWVDGKPATHRSSFLHLAPGEHTITVYNYGFTPNTQTIQVAGGDEQRLEVKLQPVPGRVSGPWGRIQIEGVPGNSLVFMNGTTPEFFVGHADEMNNNFITKQQLIVPAGTHQLTIVRRKTNEPIWSGQVDVKEDKRLIILCEGRRQSPHGLQGLGERQGHQKPEAL